MSERGIRGNSEGDRISIVGRTEKIGATQNAYTGYRTEYSEIPESALHVTGEAFKWILEGYREIAAGTGWCRRLDVDSSDAEITICALRIGEYPARDIGQPKIAALAPIHSDMGVSCPFHYTLRRIEPSVKLRHPILISDLRTTSS